MWKRIISLLLISIVICLVLTSESCASTTQQVQNITATSSIINIPSTSYPIDIIGHVTVANSVMAGGTTYQLNGSQYWIVQIALRNKLSQTFILAGISIVSTNNPTNFAGIGNPMVLPDYPPAGKQGAQYTPGETNQFTLCFGASNGLDPKQYQICVSYNVLNGQTVSSEKAYGALVNTGSITEAYNWDLQQATGLTSSQTSVTQSTAATPSGTYTGTIIGNIQQSVSFQSNNTLVVNNNVEGKTIYKYVINNDGTITETNIVTNQTGTESYQYFPQYKLVVLGGISYYK
jgi:hypothetical protein